MKVTIIVWKDYSIATVQNKNEVSNADDSEYKRAINALKQNKEYVADYEIEVPA